jgi:DNA processing protein
VSTVPDAVRLARAGLSRVAEPVVPELVTLVERHGAAAIWAGVQDGTVRLPAGALDRLRQRLGRWRPEDDLARVERLGGRLVCPGDDEWPQPLAVLAAERSTPLALWARGPGRLADLCENAVAVVGARAATDYGSYVAAELAADLARAGHPVISGAAYGIDGAAHRGALSVGGGTAAVLACGVDVAYPAGHAALLHRIAEQGALISEWPPGCAPHRHRFLVRNRVIAAAAAGTVVVEAALRSGALNTAGYAARYGRPVLAVPGPVTSAMSAGCHRLLRDGVAQLVTSAGEVAEAVGPLVVVPEERRPVPSQQDLLSARVRDALPRRGAVPAERVATVAGLGLAETLAALSELEAAGSATRVAEGWRMAG